MAAKCAHNIGCLTNVLGSVVNDTHEPDPARDGWIPRFIDHGAKLIIGQVTNVDGQRLGGGVEVIQKRASLLHAYRVSLCRSMPVAYGLPGLPKPNPVRELPPHLRLAGQISQLCVDLPAYMPEQPGDGIIVTAKVRVKNSWVKFTL